MTQVTGSGLILATRVRKHTDEFIEAISSEYRRKNRLSAMAHRFGEVIREFWGVKLVRS